MSAPAALFPVEIWREIIRFATGTTDSWNSIDNKSESRSFKFNWPHTSFCGILEDASPKTKYALARTSFQFWHITSEFLYETVYIRCAEHARAIAASPALQAALTRWTKHLIIAPVFAESISNAEFSPLAKQFGDDVEITLGCCKGLQALIIRADAASKRLAMFELWMKICRAIPPGVQHLDIDDDIHAPSSWEPKHLLETGYDISLRSLRLTAVQNIRQYDIPNITHLALYSWPIASKWNIPSLTHLYVTHFPNMPRANTFWMSPKPTLELLHFGYATDLGSFPELASLLFLSAPNLQSLEYYYYGDSDMTWNPSFMPKSLKHVTIKTYHHWATGYKRGQLLEANFPEDELDSQLPPAAKERWRAFARHLAMYPVRPTVLFPKGISIKRLEAVVKPIFDECNAVAYFVETP